MRVDRVIGATAFLTLSYQKEPLAFINDLIIPLVIFMIVQLGTGKSVESLVRYSGSSLMKLGIICSS